MFKWEELTMSSEAASTGLPEALLADDQVLRERVRGLMSQFLQQGRIDPEGVRQVARMIAGAVAPPLTASPAGESGTEFTDVVSRLDAALVLSADAVHRALGTIATRGKDVTDNDIKGALTSLMTLRDDCQSALDTMREGTSGNLGRELSQLAVHAQNVSVEASARAGAFMNELANRMGNSYRENAAPSLDLARAFSARMALLTSGIIAGVADALSDQGGSRKAK
jgi:hypothetical protein